MINTGSDAMKISQLNNSYRGISPFERVVKFYENFSHFPILCTSSFGITSGVLLGIISKINPRQKIHFIDTRNHFLETNEYKLRLSHLLNLKVISFGASPDVHEMAIKHKLWNKNADYCCHIKKVKPLLHLKKKYNFWVTGLQSWQTEHRSKMDVFERSGGLIKFNPLIDMSKKDCFSLLKEYSIPKHPLMELGYNSVSCIYCTEMGNDRDGRWSKLDKTECGLHYSK